MLAGKKVGVRQVEARASIFGEHVATSIRSAKGADDVEGGSVTKREPTHEFSDCKKIVKLYNIDLNTDY